MDSVTLAGLSFQGSDIYTVDITSACGAEFSLITLQNLFGGQHSAVYQGQDAAPSGQIVLRRQGGLPRSD